MPFPLAWSVSRELYAWRLRQPGAVGSVPRFLLSGFDDAQEAGFDGVELSLSVLEQPGRAEAVLGALSDRGLSLAGVLATVRGEAQFLARRVDSAARAGCRQLVLVIAHHDRTVRREPRRTAEVLSAVTSLVPDGISICWHPHSGELVGAGAGAVAVLEETDPNKIGICLDVGWALRCGEDPSHLIRVIGNRLRAVHVRDFSDGAWCQAVGEGDLDIGTMLGALDSSSFEGWLTVESKVDRGTVVTRDLAANGAAAVRALRRPRRQAPLERTEP